MSNKKECILCGNPKYKELEEYELYSDGDGNEIKEKTWICKEGKGCC